MELQIFNNGEWQPLSHIVIDEKIEWPEITTEGRGIKYLETHNAYPLEGTFSIPLGDTLTLMNMKPKYLMVTDAPDGTHFEMTFSAHCWIKISRRRYQFINEARHVYKGKQMVKRLKQCKHGS